MPMTHTADSPAPNTTLRGNSFVPIEKYHNKTSNRETNSSMLKIMYANIRGLKGKRSSLIEQLNAEQPHLFLLTETLLLTDFDAQIEGYTFFSRARTGKQGGGVAILAREDICKNLIPHISDREIEMIWVSYKIKKCSPLFIGCYYGK